MMKSRISECGLRIEKKGYRVSAVGGRVIQGSRFEARGARQGTYGIDVRVGKNSSESFGSEFGDCRGARRAPLGSSEWKKRVQKKMEKKFKKTLLL
jgi:hypothetical protein